MSTKKIQITTPIVTSVNGKTGDVTIDTSGGSGTTQMKKLTFTGGATGEYDGSSDVSIEIPNGAASVQPDWNQNDSSASDYIKNRPFYTINMDSITWDGSTEGRQNVVGFYYLINELNTTAAYFIGATVVLTTILTESGEIQTQESVVIASSKVQTTTNNTISTKNLYFFYDADESAIPIFLALEDNTVFENLTFPKKGLYALCNKDTTDGTTAYVSSIIPLSTNANYKTLDSNYLPAATTTSLGAIKVGNGLSIAEDGTLSVTTATYYSGTSTPANTLGADGDLYLQTEG